MDRSERAEALLRDPEGLFRWMDAQEEAMVAFCEETGEALVEREVDLGSIALMRALCDEIAAVLGRPVTLREAMAMLPMPEGAARRREARESGRTCRKRANS